MPRTARVVVPGVPHHVTQRGNRGQDVFFAADHRERYLGWLAHYSQRYGLKVWAYCLMTNHVHFVVVPRAEDSMATTLRSLQMRHSQRVNAERGWRGHLWQSRYFSCALDYAHLREAVRYVERNPVRTAIVADAEAYPWSSAAAHCGLRRDPLLSPDLHLTEEIEDWASWLRQREDTLAIETLRRRTLRGLPCGGDDFVAGIEAMTGRLFVDRARGRPRKT